MVSFVDPVLFEGSEGEYTDMGGLPARQAVARRLRSHDVEGRDRAIADLFVKVSSALAAESLENWAESYVEDRWKGAGSRKIARQLRDTAQASARQELWEFFEKEYRVLTRLERRADDYEGCREFSYRVRHLSDDCGTRIHHPHSCDTRGCARCGSRKVSRLVEQYTDRTAGLFECYPWRKHFTAYALTLTTRADRKDNPVPEYSEIDSVLRAGSWMGKRFFTTDNRGWMFALELGSKTGMVHLHWIIIAPRRKAYQRWPIDVGAVGDAWKRACELFNFAGDGGFPLIEEIGSAGASLQDEIAHVVKYVSKPMTFDPERYADILARTPSNARWIRSGGVLYAGSFPTLRHVQLAEQEHELVTETDEDTIEQIEKAVRACNKNKFLAAARRAELERVRLRYVPGEPRCPDCGDLLYIDFGFSLDRITTERDGYLALKECRPPPNQLAIS